MQLTETYTTGTTIEIEESSSEEHDFTVDRGGEIPPRERANFACPQCDRELAPGAWNSWFCGWCDNIVYVEGGGQR